jgi:hypothetical protein
MSGIRTHDPSIQEGEDISCLRPRGHCDVKMTIVIAVSELRLVTVFRIYFDPPAEK